MGMNLIWFSWKMPPRYQELSCIPTPVFNRPWLIKEYRRQLEDRWKASHQELNQDKPSLASNREIPLSARKGNLVNKYGEK